MNQDENLREYYNKRAAEYERIYQKPERQNGLAQLKEDLKSRFVGLDVLEVACGTGYWTVVISQSAHSVLASDQSVEVLEIAKSKNLSVDRVKFIQSDAYHLNLSRVGANAGFAGFWWSHIPKTRLREFLEGFHGCLAKNAKIVFIDNAFVEGSSTPIARKDSDGNTFQLRSLDNGSQYEVLKNFPTDSELLEAVKPFASSSKITRYQYYWMLEYQLC